MPAAGAIAILLLAGCGPAPASHHAHTSSLLLRASNSALATSVAVSFSGSVSVNDSSATGLTQAELQALRQLGQTTLTGSARVENRQNAEATYTASPLLPYQVSAVVANGQTYLRVGSGSWYGPLSSKMASPSLAPGAGSFVTTFKKWLSGLSSSTKVQNLGTTTLNGQTVDHLQAQVAGTSLHNLLGGLVGSSGGGSQLGGLSSLLQFGTETVDAYVDPSTDRPVQVNETGSLTVQLGPLGLLDPSQFSGTAGGQVALTMNLKVGLSDYGADYNIQAPGSPLPGLPPSLAS